MDKSLSASSYRYVINRKIPCIVYYEDIDDFSNKKVISIMKEMCKKYPLVLCYKVNWRVIADVKLNIENHTSSDILSFKKGVITCRISPFSESELHNLFKTVYNDCVINNPVTYDIFLIKHGKISKGYVHNKYNLKYPSYNIWIIYNENCETRNRLRSCKIGHIPVKRYMEISQNINHDFKSSTVPYISFDTVGYHLKDIFLYPNYQEESQNDLNSIYNSKIVFNNFVSRNNNAIIDLNKNYDIQMLNQNEELYEDKFKNVDNIKNIDGKNGLNMHNINILSYNDQTKFQINADHINKPSHIPQTCLNNFERRYFNSSIQSKSKIKCDNFSKKNICKESKNVKKRCSKKEFKSRLSLKPKLLIPH